jgi:hypothetical protein
MIWQFCKFDALHTLLPKKIDKAKNFLLELTEFPTDRFS